jgi:GNAT superfamily N-acetyltransferase
VKPVETLANAGKMRSRTGLVFTRAEAADAPVIADIRNAAARQLTTQYGKGHWSNEVTERSAAAELRHAQVLIAWQGADAAATFRLATRKPWAIDRSYFSDSKVPIYLTGMAVRPDLQSRGIGRQCVDEALRIVSAWPADALRLDAYDAHAGAGTFYSKCGFREVGRTSYRSVPLIYYELLVSGLAKQNETQR